MLRKLRPPSSVTRIESLSAHLVGAVAEVVLVVGEELEPRTQLFGAVVARMASGQSCHERSGEDSERAKMHRVSEASQRKLAS